MYPLIKCSFVRMKKVLLFVKILMMMLIGVGFIACKSTEPAKSSTSADESSELEDLYWSRVDSARMASFTQADVKFMTGMIAHHAQALVMSRLAPKNNASPQIQRLAARIINAQKDEIASMQQWLRDRNQPVPTFEIDGINLTVTINNEPWTSYRKMHGVLSQEQLEKLSEAKGKDFDRLFLKQMIEHHAGAVYMVDNLFNTDGAAQDEEAFRLASDIQVDQKTEIERMKKMLEQISEIR